MNIKNEIKTVPPLLTLDLSGRLIIEGANRFLNYDSRQVSVSSKGKTIYIYGRDLKITSYSKLSISVTGNIDKIELFEVR